MNSPYIKIILIFASVYLLLRFLPAIPISSVITQKQDLFAVTGSGKVTVVPDTGQIELGITTTAADVKTAQNQANVVIKKITSDLKNLGLPEKDIKTSNYSIYPQYDYQPGGANRIKGYQVSANLSVTIRSLDLINKVIDTASTDGANSVSAVQLTVDETRQKELLQEARKQAVADAKSKAESLSHAAGLSLGRLVNVSESTPNYPRPYLMSADMMAVKSGTGEPTQIQPGSTDITSSVTLSYETR